jgi:thioredoxin 1
MIEVKKFYGEWCVPCKRLAPVIEEVKSQFLNVKFENYDVDIHSDVASKFGIRSVPTVVIVKDGVEVKRIMGAQSKITYESSINEHLL